MEVVGLPPVSALQMERFQEEKKLLSAHLCVRHATDQVFSPEGMEESTDCLGSRDFLTCP